MKTARLSTADPITKANSCPLETIELDSETNSSVRPAPQHAATVKIASKRIQTASRINRQMYHAGAGWRPMCSLSDGSGHRLPPASLAVAFGKCRKNY